jgi:polar amino acid transport system substrate-binding protein
MRACIRVLYAFLLSLLASQVLSDHASEEQKAELVLVTHNLAPYSWLDDKGKMKGLTVEVADLLFEAADVSKRWRVMPQKRAYNYVKATPNTCVFPSQRNQEREASYRWISPMLITRYAAFAPKGSAIKVRTLQDMQAYKVVTQLGSGIKEYLTAFDIDVIEVVKDEQAAAMVTLGRADLWAADILSKVHLQGALKTDFDQQFVFFTSISAMACHRDVPEHLIKHLQAHLSELYRSQKVSKIVRKYAEAEN